jgi:uncharacterized protein (TIGR00251 family)
MVFVSTNKENKANLKIIVKPKAKRTLFLGLHDNMVKLGVAAPPVDGKANKEVVAYLADFFGLKKKEVEIVTGENSRRKICSIGRLSEKEVRRKVEKYLQS